MSGGAISPGKLMITSDLETWAFNYAPNRSYAALIDMSLVPSKEYFQVNRGFGNEFFVHDPSRAVVVGVFSIKDALRIDYEHHQSLPQNFEELSQFWHMSQQSEIQHLSPDELLSHSHEEWEKQWQDDWANEWEPQ